MEFTNREIAGYIWLALFFGWAVRNRDVRRSLAGAMRTFCHHLILIPLGLAALYIAALVAVLERVGLWTSDNLKTTILWAISFAFATMLDINRVSEDRTFFGKATREAFAISGVLTFMIEFYSFSLLIELVAVPFVTFLGLLQIVASHRPEHATVGKLMTWLLAIIVVGYFGYSLYRTAAELSEFARWSTLLDFGMPIILTIGFLPFIYVLVVYVVYESTFSILPMSISDEKLRRQAKWHAFVAFRTNTELLRRWSHSVARFEAKDRESLSRSFAEIKEVAWREANPPTIDRGEGWSPYVAKDFLKVGGLVTRPYHRSFEDEWFAGSNFLEIGDGALPNQMAYYLNGNEEAVTELVLKLSINQPQQASEAEDKFVEIGVALLVAALGEHEAELYIGRLARLVSFSEGSDARGVSLKQEMWNGGIKGGFSRSLTIRQKHRGS